MPRDKRDEVVLAKLPKDVAEIFNEVQVSNTNHDKNCAKLYKFHDQAREITKESRGGGIKLVGERAFQKAFLACIFKTLTLRKGDACADRTAQFVGAYLKFVNEKGTLHCFPVS